MSNSIVSVLTPPNTSTTTPNALDTSTNGTRPITSLKSLKAPPSPNPSSTGSLLDDEDEDEAAAKLGSKAVLQPSTAMSGPALPAPVSAVGKKIGEKKTLRKEKMEGSADFDDEEWNW